MSPTGAVYPGRFITLEGVDGAGKSTHTTWLVDTLQERGFDVVSTREPGGTPLGERLRELLLTQDMGLDTETLLMFAARSEHLQHVIVPALARGAWVVCDRYTDATYAYQGGGRGLGAARVALLEQWLQPPLRPDLTWLFDVPLAVARARMAGERQLDRFEQEAEAFFERTRTAYHARAAAEPGRMHIIDASRPLDEVRRALEQDLLQFLANT
ncbi:dTMP kinase [Bordetella avium]|nr:dTMP kinase [Bordetella avium]AZY50885.1 dTMP kinase [Bordetella avium]AZY54280.1 dTMP kinase [Bordetella avium]RIQ12368.1 dTMP kinase [Bordetella avium]RIQ19445.1 dTMP kinase [Bordetella avium]RIQ33594.1 dTMP kinase [Bordetella avium]